MMGEAYQQTEQILKDHMEELHRLAGVLFEREKVDAQEFLDVMNGKLLPSAMAQNALEGQVPAEPAGEQAPEKPEALPESGPAPTDQA